MKTMKPRAFLAGALSLLSVAALVGATASLGSGKVGAFWGGRKGCGHQDCGPANGTIVEEFGGTWYWMRSPDEEKRVVMGLYTRYCVRCHAIDGRGVWDIPDVPNFTNTRWQASRSDGQLARIILEGRGAVMPPFRGTMTLEESWAMARYLRTFVPGTEVSRPDLDQGSRSAPQAKTAPSR